MADRPSVLIMSSDVVGESMAGPGIRCWEIAKALSTQFRVTLAVPNNSRCSDSCFEVTSYCPPQGDGTEHNQAIGNLVDQADTVLVSGSLLRDFPVLVASGKPLIVDLYVPFFLENLELFLNNPHEEKMRTHLSGLAVLKALLERGDIFLCASERQRDFLLGLLVANNRINPLTYAQDTSLRSLVITVPFGLESRPPHHSRRVLKGVHPGIGSDDKVILWGGGVWEWLDPLTLIRALGRVVQQMPEVKLFFLGTRHPNRAKVPEMNMTRQAVSLSKNLGLYDKYVFFNEWIPYDSRENYLLEADLGVSLHFDCIETRFAFRTRILDYLWAKLPMVLSGGDHLSELVSAYHLGKVVQPGDEDGVAAALTELLAITDLRSSLTPNFVAVSNELTWEKAVEPLAVFLAHPDRAVDTINQARERLDSRDEADELRNQLIMRDAEVAALSKIVAGYERGRVMRVLNTVEAFRKEVMRRISRH